MVRECAVQVREEHQDLRPYVAILNPLKARPKIGAASSDRCEMDLLTGLIDVDLMHLSVKVNDVHAFRSLSFENRAHLRFEQRELPRVDRAGAIDEDDNFSDAFALNTG